MRSAILFFIVAILITAALVQSGVLDALIAFLLAGAVPGTTFSVPPSIMLAAFGILAWLALFHLTAVKMANFVSTKRLVTRHMRRHQRMPKRRFGRV